MITLPTAFDSADNLKTKQAILADESFGTAKTIDGYYWKKKLQGIGYTLMTPFFFLALGQLSDTGTIVHNPARDIAKEIFPYTRMGNLITLAGNVLQNFGPA